MNIAGLHLEKPIMNASGTLSRENVHEVKELYGALVTKSVTVLPHRGNPPPRVSEVPGGMMNSIGLQNYGIEKLLDEELDEWCSAGLPVIVSIGERSEFGVRVMARTLAEMKKVAALELNLSCPNLDGDSFCDWPAEVANAVYACREDAPNKPLIAKLALNNYLINSEVAAKAGADAITLINSIPALTWLPGSSEPFLGGLSGPAIKHIALRAVYEVSRAVDVPVIGCGGIAGPEDIKDFMQAGASAVQIGSASFVREPQEVVGGG